MQPILRDGRLGLLPIIGPAIAFAAIAYCVMQSPWFSWTDNAISDFGVSEHAIIFNLSLIVCGILCAIFFLALFIQIEERLGKLGMLLLMLSCIFLAGVGIFNEDIWAFHIFFAAGFFASFELTQRAVFTFTSPSLF